MAPNWKPLSNRELDRQIEEARRHSEIADPGEPRAVSARYDAARGRVELELKDGCLFAFPADMAEGLRGASPAALAKLELVGDGYALHWEDLDVHFTVPGLLAGRLGSRVWMREHARRAGSTTSEAKAEAARRNGMRGGRPPRSGKKGRSGGKGDAA